MPYDISFYSNFNGKLIVSVGAENMGFGFIWSGSGKLINDKSNVKISFVVNKQISHGAMFTHLINKTLTPLSRKKNQVTAGKSESPKHGHKVK